MTDLMIVGEAWGQEEADRKLPFVGPSGRLLNALLSEAGIVRKECYVTNVFNLKPQPTNDISNLCGPKVEGIPGMKALTPGKYVRKEYHVEVGRLWDEVRAVNPNLILALGNTAIWALCRGKPYISKQRGATMPSHILRADGSPYKVLAAYHPAAVMRQWTLRPILQADLVKAHREQDFPDIRRPHREVWIEPTLADMIRFDNNYIIKSDELSVDIETTAEMITCIGFAPTIDRAIVIPFLDREQPDGNYWRTHEEERHAWDIVRIWCGLEKAVYVGQNFLYDAHFLYRTMGIRTRHTDDTMLLHHALQPEMEKGLGFLGSIYTDEAGWKIMRGHTDTLKKEDI